MRTLKTINHMLVVIALAMAAVLYIILSFVPQAQATEEESLEERQIALARICASEEGLSRPTAGCAAIYAVISNAAERRNIPWLQQAREGSRQSFNTRRRDSRRWIAFLSPDGAQPAGWPEYAWRRVTVEDDDGVEREMMERVQHAPWSMPDRGDDYQRRWLRVYEHAGRIVRGEERDACRLGDRRVDPHYWGCPPDARGQCRDHERAERARWVHLDCGDTRNWFYCDPRMSSGCQESEPQEELLGG